MALKGAVAPQLGAGRGLGVVAAGRTAPATLWRRTRSLSNPLPQLIQPSPAVAVDAAGGRVRAFQRR